MRALDAAIRTKLVADGGAGGINTLTGGRIFKILAPQGTNTYPYLLYQDISGTPEYTFTLETIRRFVYRFKAYDKSESWAAIGDIADRLDVLLFDTSLSITGWTLNLIRLRQRFDSVEEENGIIYPLVLSDYDIMLQKA